MLVNGLWIGYSNPHAGSVHDIEIFRGNVSWNVWASIKVDGCFMDIKEFGELATNWSNDLAVLLHKAYLVI